jgi:hypothetical protein
VPNQPPSGFWNEKLSKIKQSLKDAHPDWTPETLDDRARKTLGDVWYNKMSPEDRQTQTKKYEGAGPQGQGPQQSFPNKDPQLSAEDMAKCLAIAKEEPAGWTPQESEAKMPDQLNRTDRGAQDESTNFDQSSDEVQPPYQEGVTDDKLSGGEQDIGGGNDTPEGTVGIDEVAQVQKTPPIGIQAKKGKVMASKKASIIHIPAYRMTYVATMKPAFEGNDGPVLIKAVVLEPGQNINQWEVRPSQFQKVADAYKAGRQLRTDHSKDMDKVIGKSYNGMVMKGSELPQWLGTSIQGIKSEDPYVVAEFEATPRNPQVRTNILQGYVDTGSIGLDAKAYCKECRLPLEEQDGQLQKTCRHFDSGVELDEVDVKEYSYVAEPAFEHTLAFPSFSAAVSSSLSGLRPKSRSVSSRVTAAKKAEAESDAEADADAIAQKYINWYKKGLAEGAKFRAVDVPPEDEGNKVPGRQVPNRNVPTSTADAEAEGEGKQDDFDRPTAEAGAEGEGEGEGVGEADAGAVTPGKPPGQFPDSDQLKTTPQQLGPGTYRQITVPNPDSSHPVQGRRTDQVGRMMGRGTKNGTKGATLWDAAWNSTAQGLKDPLMVAIFKAAATQTDTPAEIKQKLGRKDLRWE